MIYQKKTFNEFPNYSIDSLGIVRNERNGKVLKVYYTNKGYSYLSVSNKIGKKRIFIHKSVAQIFLNYFHGCHVHHKDGNKKNNNIDNLECITPFEHRKVSFEIGHCKLVDKPIDQYTKAMVFIKSYNSIMDAYRETKIDFRYISACLLGKQKSANGFLFFNKGEIPKEYKKNKSGRKSYEVFKYSKNGILIKNYNNLHEAYLDSNVSKSKICNSVNKQTKTKGDYFWSKKQLEMV